VDDTDGGQRLFVGDAVALENLPRGGPRLAAGAETAGGPELFHQPGSGGAVALAQIEQQALEIAGNLDIHAGAERRLDRGGLHLAAVEEPGQDIVAVGADDEPGDVQPHRPRRIAGIDVAEIARGHGEHHRPVRRAEPERGVKIIDDLGHHPSPVDRVHRRQVHLVAERGVVEHRLQQILAIVESAVDGDVVDVGRLDRGHLPPLDLGDPALGMQDEDI
jgi:hypothetical protein